MYVFDVTIIFGGSPIGVSRPPMFAWTIIPISTGIGCNSITSQILIVIGVINKIVDTLSKNDDTKAVITHSQ